MRGAGGFLCESLRAREQSEAIMSCLYKNLWPLSDMLQMTSRENKTIRNITEHCQQSVLITGNFIF